MWWRALSVPSPDRRPGRMSTLANVQLRWLGICVGTDDAWHALGAIIGSLAAYTLRVLNPPLVRLTC